MPLLLIDNSFWLHIVVRFKLRIIPRGVNLPSDNKARPSRRLLFSSCTTQELVCVSVSERECLGVCVWELVPPFSHQLLTYIHINMYICTQTLSLLHIAIATASQSRLLFKPCECDLCDDTKAIANGQIVYKSAIKSHVHMLLSNSHIVSRAGRGAGVFEDMEPKGPCWNGDCLTGTLPHGQEGRKLTAVLQLQLNPIQPHLPEEREGEEELNTSS